MKSFEVANSLQHFTDNHISNCSQNNGMAACGYRRSTFFKSGLLVMLNRSHIRLGH